MMGFGMGYGWIFWIILIGILIWVIIQFTGSGKTGRGSEDKKSEAIEILKQRYARGELSKEEFEQKKRDIEH